MKDFGNGGFQIEEVQNAVLRLAGSGIREVIARSYPALRFGRDLVLTLRREEIETLRHLGVLQDWIRSRTEKEPKSSLYFPLRGSVLSCDDPTGPVAEDDWEAAQ